MATEIWVNIRSGNGLLPDGTKPLPEPMLIYHQQVPLAFIWVQFYKRYLSYLSLKLAGKFLSSNLSNLLVANELKGIPICRQDKCLFLLIFSLTTPNTKSWHVTDICCVFVLYRFIHTFPEYLTDAGGITHEFAQESGTFAQTNRNHTDPLTSITSEVNLTCALCVLLTYSWKFMETSLVVPLSSQVAVNPLRSLDGNSARGN